MPLASGRIGGRLRVGLRAVALSSLAALPTTAAAQTPSGPTSPTVRPVLAPDLDSFIQHRARRSHVYADVPLPSVVGDAKPADAADAAPELGLGECLAIAMERQPSLRAVQASQQATQVGLQALQNIGRLGELVRPDLPIRRQQACRGVTAAAADVQKIHNEVVYDVTRLYYTAIYARQQEQVAADVVSQLDSLIEVAKALLDSPMPGEMNALKYQAMLIGRAEARTMHLIARQGNKQALAALREAMGVSEESYPFRIKDTELPLMGVKVPLTKEVVIQMAVERRPELALAAAGVDAFRLEVYAQQKMSFRRSVPTFATGSDLHAHPVPQTVREQEYRPGAIEPEMPNFLVGTKSDRVGRAMWYSQRADAVYEKARNLVALDAETSFLRYEEATMRLQITKEKNDAGNRLAELSRQGQENIKAKDQLVQNEVLAAKAKSDYIEAVYKHLLALAALERVTAGGVQPAFPGR